ncbi:hypothetical protein IT084_01775 [Desulfallas sp. Bu1-1]|uniref:hypothetical protein n=1 Tax=Desulfallas sp. Bu1-1 TaxID=2787620 RepID=UPI00189E2308|nr:hypothetical protein [Desulfallas sp. Bu1-1]MBF7081711.1 hypothetical protein [Desulfallas sp. Bu1-1]
MEWLEAGVEVQTRDGRQKNLVVVDGGQAAGGGAGGGTPEYHEPFNTGENAGSGSPAGRGHGAAEGIPAQEPPPLRGETERVGNPAHGPQEENRPGRTPAQTGVDRTARPPKTTSQAPATQAQIRKIHTTAGETGLDDAMLGQILSWTG